MPALYVKMGLFSILKDDGRIYHRFPDASLDFQGFRKEPSKRPKVLQVEQSDLGIRHQNRSQSKAARESIAHGN